MNCPACEAENIEGVELCERCGNDLSSLFHATGGSLLEQRLAGETVGAIKLLPPIKVTPDMTVSAVAAVLTQNRFGCALVAEGDRLLGIFTERDLLTKVMLQGAEARRRPVREFMTAGPQTIGIDDPIATALKQMLVGEYRHLPVVDGARLVGVLSVRDLMAYLYEESLAAFSSPV
jgi:CBS domain-containing protein